MEWSPNPTPEGVALGALLGLALVSYLAAWRWEGIGGAALVVAGLSLGGFSFWAAGTNKALIALIMGLPSVVAGALFHLSLMK